VLRQRNRLNLSHLHNAAASASCPRWPPNEKGPFKPRTRLRLRDGHSFPRAPREPALLRGRPNFRHSRNPRPRLQELALPLRGLGLLAQPLPARCLERGAASKMRHMRAARAAAPIRLSSDALSEAGSQGGTIAEAPAARLKAQQGGAAQPPRKPPKESQASRTRSKDPDFPAWCRAAALRIRCASLLRWLLSGSG